MITLHGLIGLACMIRLGQGSILKPLPDIVLSIQQPVLHESNLKMVKEIVCISSVRNHAIPAPDITKYAAKPDSYDRLSAAQIGDFFKKHEAFTQEYCNRLAANLVKSTVSPTLVQGATSYTVVADNAAKVVQFRTHELDMLSIELARKSYAGFVPRCEAYGKLGTIHMYVWELVRGQAFCRVRHRFLAPDMEEFLTQTIRDFARYVEL